MGSRLGRSLNGILSNISNTSSRRTKSRKSGPGQTRSRHCKRRIICGGKVCNKCSRPGSQFPSTTSSKISSQTFSRASSRTPSTTSSKLHNHDTTYDYERHISRRNDRALKRMAFLGMKHILPRNFAASLYSALSERSYVSVYLSCLSFR